MAGLTTVVDGVIAADAAEATGGVQADGAAGGESAAEVIGGVQADGAAVHAGRFAARP
jgi:hypothetical protein